MPEFNFERLVEENRFTIAVIFPLVGSLGFIASAENMLPNYLAFSPLLILFGTLVMRLPLIAGLGALITRRSALGLMALGLYAYLIEFIGLKTGLPYGEFEYLVELGPMVDGVPVGLPVFFIPLVINSYLLVILFDVKPFWKRFLSTLGVIIMVDLVLDPAAVALGIWSYAGGFFYSVPTSNFLGWLLSGSFAVLILEYIFDASDLGERLNKKDYMLDDMVSFVFIWGFVNLYYGNILPVFIAFFFGALLYDEGRFEFASMR